MKLHDLKIEGSGAASPLRVHLDGEPLYCTAFRLEADAGCLPRLVADLPLVESTAFDGQVTVFIPDVTRDALIKLGWTPPAGEATQ